jgi:hypothetical protein
MAHPGGRPTELTPAVIEDVKRFLPTAMYMETVADYLGITRQTVGNWLRRGRRERNRRDKGKPAQPEESLCLEFFTAVKKAVSEGLLSDLGIIKKCAQGGYVLASKKVTRTTAGGDTVTTEETRYAAPEWTAAAWRAERRFPELWGKDNEDIREIRDNVREMRAQQTPAPEALPEPIVVEAGIHPSDDE